MPLCVTRCRWDIVGGCNREVSLSHTWTYDCFLLLTSWLGTLSASPTTVVPPQFHELYLDGSAAKCARNARPRSAAEHCESIIPIDLLSHCFAVLQPHATQRPRSRPAATILHRPDNPTTQHRAFPSGDTLRIHLVASDSRVRDGGLQTSDRGIRRPFIHYGLG